MPVIEDAGLIVADSTVILEYLDRRYPERPLYPAKRAARAETGLFIDWFNRIWKRAPNAIEDELSGESPDQRRIAGLAREMAAHLDLFEGLLDGRDFLLGDQVSAADFSVFPFLKYAARRDPADDESFHVVLDEYQRLGPGHAGLAAWIERIDALPRAY